MTGQSRNSLGVHAAAWCDRIALAVLLLVIGLRPLVQERATSRLMGMDRVLEGSPGPGPELSIMLTALILAALLLVAVSRVLAPRAWRWVGIELGFALVAVAAVASCFVAGNKRIAVNETANWLALPLLALVLCQLLSRPLHIRLTVAVIIAGAATFAFKCWRQESREFEETIEYYSQIKGRVWAEQGITLDDPRVALFERRLYGREASGFFSHSNVAGSYLVCAAFVAAAAAWEKLTASRGLIWRLLAGANMLLALGLAAAVALTGSLGAAASGIVALLLLAAGLALRRRLTSRPFLWLAMAWGTVAACAVGVVGYGREHGSLPSASLAFRWQYWANSASLIADHFWRGVGTANFGDHYLRYKPVTSPEEIQDPHNLFVTAAAQWGLFGAAGLAAMIVGASICLVRPARPGAREPPAPTKASGSSPDSLWPVVRAALWTCLLCLAIFQARSWAAGPLDGHPPRVWLCAFLLVFVDRATLGFDVIRADTRCPAIIGVGLAAFLLHATIDFAFYQHGSATTAMSALAVAAAIRHAPGRNTAAVTSRRRVGAWCCLLGAVGAAAAFAGLAAAPTLRVATLLTEARACAPDDRAAAESAYQRAINADPLDPGPPAELAEWLASGAVPGAAMEPSALDAAWSAADTAVRRNPNSVGAWRVLGRSALAKSQATDDASAGRSAISAIRRAVSLYPASPDLRVELADTLVTVATVGRNSKGSRHFREAIEHYQQALALDGRRSPHEIRRFSANRRAAIVERITKLREMVAAAG